MRELDRGSWEIKCNVILQRKKKHLDLYTEINQLNPERRVLCARENYLKSSLIITDCDKTLVIGILDFENQNNRHSIPWRRQEARIHYWAEDSWSLVQLGSCWYHELSVTRSARRLVWKATGGALFAFVTRRARLFERGISLYMQIWPPTSARAFNWNCTRFRLRWNKYAKLNHALHETGEEMKTMIRKQHCRSFQKILFASFLEKIPRS